MIEGVQPLSIEAALAALETRGRENVTNRCRVELGLEHSGFEAALARRNA